MKKECFKCKKTKPISDFYPHKRMVGGYLNKCKECTKEDVTNRYRNPEYRERIKEYEKKRNKEVGRKQKRAEYQRRHRKSDMEKYRVRSKTSHMLCDGRLQKQPCEVCGEKRVHAHHIHYNEPIEIKWLCREHHLQEHNKSIF